MRKNDQYENCERIPKLACEKRNSKSEGKKKTFEVKKWKITA